MARHAAAFIDALGLKQIDLLGFSLGGLVAQQLTLDRPKLVRRLVLVGTGPRSGEGMATLTPEAKAIFGKTYAVPDELWLEVFFSPTETSQAAGQAFLQRLRARKENRDPSINEKVAPAQIAALEEWGAPRNEPYAYLKNIKQPVLIMNGSNDVYTVNSFILQQNLPNAQLILYPDSNHGSQYPFPELFVEHVTLFLGGPSSEWEERLVAGWRLDCSRFSRSTLMPLALLSHCMFLLLCWRRPWAWRRLSVCLARMFPRVQPRNAASLRPSDWWINIWPFPSNTIAGACSSVACPIQ